MALLRRRARGPQRRANSGLRPMIVQRAMVAALVLSALSFGVVLADPAATMTVDGISSIIPSGNAGRCPYQIDVGFDVTITGSPTGWYNTGIDQSTVNASTVKVDGARRGEPRNGDAISKDATLLFHLRVRVGRNGWNPHALPQGRHQRRPMGGHRRQPDPVCLPRFGLDIDLRYSVVPGANARTHTNSDPDPDIGANSQADEADAKR